jgi:uncharacterized protein (DUF58 family)
MLRRLLDKLRRAAVRVGRLRYLVPPTPLGLAVAALGYWLAFRVGRDRVDYVLSAAGVLALLLVALALLTVCAAALVVWTGARRGARGERDLELESGMTGTSGLALPCLRSFPLLQLRVIWHDPEAVEVTLAPRAEGGCDELVRPLERGDSPRVVRRLVVSDIFGFARLGLTRASPIRVRVKPVRARVTAHVTRRFLGGDALSWPTGPSEGEPIEMRRYVYGDPLRHVLWKAFARTRKLLVRTPERAITPLPSVAAYMVAGPEDEAAASAARYFLEEGLLGRDFLFCASGASTPTADAGEALEQLIRSARHRGEDGAGLERFLARLEASRRQNCVLFVPPVAGPWLGRLERLASLCPGGQAVTSLDTHPAAPRGQAWRRMVFAEGDAGARAVRTLGEVVRQLVAAGLEVHVLHRPSGELLGRAQLAALGGPRRIHSAGGERAVAASARSRDDEVAA